ncbi:MAG: glucuronate isomerase [Deltaproteobacteria bacterium]|nr:glucuronate isomerase [Deltaproteobacteria bacterium]
MKPFLSDDFLLHTKTATVLYHDFAAPMPIFDFHCHLSVKEIADDIKFQNLYRIWLDGDHYKWRAMRTVGIDERFIAESCRTRIFSVRILPSFRPDKTLGFE